MERDIEYAVDRLQHRRLDERLAGERWLGFVATAATRQATRHHKPRCDRPAEAQKVAPRVFAWFHDQSTTGWPLHRNAGDDAKIAGTLRDPAAGEHRQRGSRGSSCSDDSAQRPARCCTGGRGVGPGRAGAGGIRQAHREHDALELPVGVRLYDRALVANGV